MEFRSLSEDFNTSTSTGKLQISMVLAFSEWWRNSIRERSVAGQAKAADRGAFPRPTAQPDRAATGVLPGGPVEGSEPAGTGQALGGRSLDHPTGGRVESRVEIAASAVSMAGWQPDTVSARAAPRQRSSTFSDAGQRGPIWWTRPANESSLGRSEPGPARRTSNGHRR